MKACGSCGTALAGAAKFCSECGSPTAGRDNSAKYKQVTVLFADVVRSMDLAAAVDIERLREIMTDFFDRSTAVVARFGGLVEYNGDGVMALFGAPIALEDHAFRGCLAALALQEEASRLAADVQRDDDVSLQLRVGLNSGRVITGEIGSGAMGYRATGLTVGMAQRLESVAPPGGVVLSESTARLVEHRAVLAEPEWLRVKGVDEPVCARRLVTVRSQGDVVGRSEGSLVGRRWEMAALDAMVDRAIGGRGAIVNVVGPPGIGKSRVAREVAGLAVERGVTVAWAFCESHAQDLSFGLIADLLREALGVSDLDDRETARVDVRRQLPDAHPQDLLLLNDLLGIADPGEPLPQIDADARRRRLTALIGSVWLARSGAAVYVIEDAHWIDAVSESMLADLLAVVPRTASVVVITSRPEYGGVLARLSASHTITLAPLSDSIIAEIAGVLLGPDPSVKELAATIVGRADGNPFFAVEMVRELVQRGVLTGDRGNHVCSVSVDEVTVPETVQAAIEARIDRLSPAAKRTLSAASVIGARFGAELLVALGIAPELDELLDVELIDQVRMFPAEEFVFCHPLIRAVAYESQLKSDRAEWHRRMAVAVEVAANGAVDERGALIAEHWQAAGDLQVAYGWHMRAAAWATNRDIAAARSSWERACEIADRLPGDGIALLSMRIAPRTMLCVTDWQALSVQNSWGRFEVLRELCEKADEKVSLVMGMTGLGTELLYAGRPGEGSRVASEQMALLQSIGDPNLTVGLAFGAYANWFNSGEFGEILRWSQIAIDLAGDDPVMGSDFGIGSPPAIARTFRGIARWWLGLPDWRQDLDDAVGMAKDSDPTTMALVVAWTQLSLMYGVLRLNDSLLRIVEESTAIAEACSNDFAVMGAKFTLGTTLLFSDDVTDRRRGEDLMVLARDEFLPARAPSLVPLARMMVARECARRGDHDGAIPVMSDAVDQLLGAGRTGWSVCSIAILVETLLDRGAEDDLTFAGESVERLAGVAAAQSAAICDITLLRLRALLARAHGDDAGYGELADQYRATAEAHGYEGHIDWAASMK